MRLVTKINLKACGLSLAAVRSSVSAAAIAATCIAFGYTIGTIAIWQLLVIGRSDRYFAIPFSEYFTNLIIFRYRYLSFDSLYSNRYELFVLAAMLASATFILSIFAKIASHYTHVRFAPIQTHSTLPDTRRAIRPVWRSELQSRFRATHWFAAAAVGLGFTGAWIGLAEAIARYHVREFFADSLWQQWAYQGWANRGTPNSRPAIAKPPEALFMTFSEYDGLWIACGSVLLVAGWTILSARRRLARSGVLAERWCLNCGYDIRGLVGITCPECHAAIGENLKSHLHCMDGASRTLQMKRVYTSGFVFICISVIVLQAAPILFMALRNEPLLSQSIPLFRTDHIIKQDATKTTTDDRVIVVYTIQTIGVVEASSSAVHTPGSQLYDQIIDDPASSFVNFYYPHLDAEQQIAYMVAGMLDDSVDGCQYRAIGWPWRCVEGVALLRNGVWESKSGWMLRAANEVHGMPMWMQRQLTWREFVPGRIIWSGLFANFLCIGLVFAAIWALLVFCYRAIRNEWRLGRVSASTNKHTPNRLRDY